MNKHFREVIKHSALVKNKHSNNYELTDEDITQLVRTVVQECSDLIKSHAKSLEAYNFKDKATTALTCSGIILEHFDIKHGVNDGNQGRC